jgi:LmbE family N-acetylglucosaminyl deacetylase
LGNQATSPAVVPCMPDEFQSLEKPKTILVVEAHPDDAAFFAGGTMIKLAQQGHTIVDLVATYGDKGTLDPKMTRAKVIKTRKDETRRAAQILGVKDVLYLGLADGELEAGLELRRKFTEVLRRVRPDLVFSFDPNCPYEPHPDHVATARTIYEACFTSHFHLYYPEHYAKGLHPHYVAKLYGWSSPNPNTFVDISGVLETKIKALEQYESQMQMLLEENRHRLSLTGMEMPLLNQLDWHDVVRLWVTLTAQAAGKQSNHEYAEAFNVIPLGMVGVISDLLKARP